MACLVCDFEIKASLILVSAGLKAVCFKKVMEEEIEQEVNFMDSNIEKELAKTSLVIVIDKGLGKHWFYQSFLSYIQKCVNKKSDFCDFITQKRDLRRDSNIRPKAHDWRCSWSDRHCLFTYVLSLSHCTSLQQPPTNPSWFFTFHFLPNFLFESFLVPLSFFSISVSAPLLSPSTFLHSLSFMPASLPLRVGCVICKCADSCSRSPSFDSAVGVINGSANCDSSQTRWERLPQPISSLYFFLFLSLWSLSLTHTLTLFLSVTQTHISYHWRLFNYCDTHLPPKLTLKHLRVIGWPAPFIPCPPLC